MKRILCFGDSNTWGLIANTKKRYDWGVRWTSRLQNAFPGERVQIIEEGLCGRTTVFNDDYRVGRAATGILPVILESHAPLDHIVLMLGTNDCKSAYGADAKTIGAGIEVLLQQIRSQLPEVKILLMSPIELGEQVWKQEYDPEFDKHSVEVSKELPEVYKEIAKRWNIDFLPASAYAEPSAEDMEHMNVIGHKRLADAVIERLYPVYGREAV